MRLAITISLLALLGIPQPPAHPEREIVAAREDHHTRWTWTEEGHLEPVGEEYVWRFLQLNLGSDCEAVHLTFEREVECVDLVRWGPGEDEREVERAIETAGAKVSCSAMVDSLLEVYDLELLSLLEGRSVRLTETDGAIERELVGEPDLEHELLLDVLPDFEPLALLPDEPVAFGDRWRVDTEAFGAVLLPGGLLALREEDETPFEFSLLSFGAYSELVRDACVFGAEYEGRVWATYRGEVTHEGRRLAQIDLDLRCELSCPWDTEFRRRIGVGGVARESVFLPRLVSVLVGEGRLFWDLERGRLSAIELDWEASHDVHSGNPGNSILGLDFRETRRLRLQAREEPAAGD